MFSKFLGIIFSLMSGGKFQSGIVRLTFSISHSEFILTATLMFSEDKVHVLSYTCDNNYATKRNH